MMAIKKFINGAKVGLRARKELARKLECSDRQLLGYLKRKHLWSNFFRPSRKVIYGIADGVRAENSIRRPQIKGTRPLRQRERPDKNVRYQ